ncbi:MAG: hypothetical protein ACKV2Q_07440 [Planctomycetaceae bacterium]
MKLTHCRRMLGVLAVLAATTLSGCMAYRPAPYNRPSFHASREHVPSGVISRAQLARWQRPTHDALVTNAVATANSSQELDVSLR